MQGLWFQLAPKQRAMLIRIALEGPLAVATKVEMRTVASLRRRELLRPGYPRRTKSETVGRWHLTAKAHRLIAERGNHVSVDDPGDPSIKPTVAAAV